MSKDFALDSSISSARLLLLLPRAPDQDLWDLCSEMRGYITSVFITGDARLFLSLSLLPLLVRLERLISSFVYPITRHEEGRHQAAAAVAVEAAVVAHPVSRVIIFH